MRREADVIANRIEKHEDCKQPFQHSDYHNTVLFSGAKLIKYSQLGRLGELTYPLCPLSSCRDVLRVLCCTTRRGIQADLAVHVRPPQPQRSVLTDERLRCRPFTLLDRAALYAPQVESPPLELGFPFVVFVQ